MTTEARNQPGYLGVADQLHTISTLGDYNILRRLGGGVLGEAYLAEHRFLKRHYVLKVISADLAAQPGFLQRFEKHVSALAQLDHPHIVKIHNVSHADGRYFLVTDAIVDVRGTSTDLKAYLSNAGKRFDEATLFEVLMQLADALDYAHALDIDGMIPIHRGIKPSNVLVREGAMHPEVFLCDFGLSPLIGTLQALTRSYGAVIDAVVQAESEAVLSGEALSSNEMPWHNACLEALSFLSPEQRRAEENRVTSSADIYSFGLLAYFAIVGELPEGAFAWPSEVASEYHWNWDHLISSCLQKDPSKRPASLVSAVKAVQSTQSAKAASSADTLYFQGDVATVYPSEGLQPSLRGSGPRIERPEIDMHPERAFQIDTAVKVYHPQPKQISEAEPILTEMVIIPAGTYWQGSSDGKRDEMPRHRVTLRSYGIDAQPVTNEQFVRFLSVMGGEKDAYHRDLIRLRDSRIKRAGGRLNIESGYHKHPVVGVTWYGAAAYAKWVGRRLPTEAEWEIAANGAGAEWPYPTGENIDKSLANYFSADTTPVGAHPANALGLYDLAGNIYEWCYDWYDYNYYEKALQEPDNPEGPAQGVYRVLRGGCWKSLKEDLRCSRRHRNNPGTVNSTYGFRCAIDVDPVV
ncbi:MAG: serine/threonine protein kinase [Nitrosomonas sp.]|nr:MAG: serine/threonine protein kinase [Nitrosomonas sp.]